jgi:hypothetical protein
MTDPLQNPVPEEAEEFTPTREHEFQDSHYHDEEPDIVDDETATRVSKPAGKSKSARRVPPPRRHYEE